MALTVCRRKALALVAAAAASARAADAGVRLVVAYPPGGLSDEVARALAAPLAADLGMPVRVEHRPGAGGAVAMEMLARAPADGRTLVFCAASPLALLPQLGPTNYDPQRDIAPVAAIMATPVLVVGTPALAAASFNAMLDIARAQPGALRWASSGLATTGHLVLEQVCLSAGVEITHVPYKGGGQQLTDALAGQFELLSSNVAPTPLEHVRSGRLRALAVGASRRLPALPAVPTLAELGHADANLQSRFGLFVRGGTPVALVERINAAANRALALPALRDRLLAASNLPLGGSAAAFAEQIAAEAEGLRRLLLRRPVRL